MTKSALKPPGDRANEAAVVKGKPTLLGEVVAGFGVGTLILVAVVVAGVVVALVAFMFHEDTIVSREYSRLFALHPDLIPAHYAELGTFHSQTAFAVSEIALTVVLAVATVVYAAITRAALRDARKSSLDSAELAQQAMLTEIRVADALERIALATEASAHRPTLATQIRAAVVLDLAGTRRRRL
jgi:hypothetical protein